MKYFPFFLFALFISCSGPVQENADSINTDSIQQSFSKGPSVIINPDSTINDSAKKDAIIRNDSNQIHINIPAPEKNIVIGKLNLQSSNGNLFEYEGEIVDGKAHGKGKGIFKNGIRYEGEFNNNVIEGKGKIYFPNDQSYEGNFQAGKFHGSGRYNWPTGDYYKGEFKKGKRTGEGILYDKKNRVKMKGIWRNDTLIIDN